MYAIARQPNPDASASAGTQTDPDALQESDILRHCRSLKRNSQHPRSFWSPLISRSHPSHPSALPLASLAASLKSLLRLIPPSFFTLEKLAPKPLKREENSVLASVSKDRGALTWSSLDSKGSPPGQAPSNLWFSYVLFSTLLASL